MKNVLRSKYATWNIRGQGENEELHKTLNKKKKIYIYTYCIIQVIPHTVGTDLNYNCV
jgi:hypothetical protein